MKIANRVASLMLLVVLLPATAESAGPANAGGSIGWACNGTAPITYVQKIPASEVAVVWKDTRASPNGYFETVVPSDYLNVIGQLLAVSSTMGIGNKERRGAFQWKQIAMLDETPHRRTVFYADGSSQAMLTRWAYIEDGAKLCFFDEFLNVKVGDARGTISLAKSSLSTERNVLWKLTWVPVGQAVQLEFYVQDSLNLNGQPTRTVQQIIELATQISG